MLTNILWFELIFGGFILNYSFYIKLYGVLQRSKLGGGGRKK